MTAPLVVAVVLNWNLPNDTIRCVRSLLASDYAALEALIVDNGSSDDSLARFAAELPGVPVIATDANLYYAGGNNVGVRAALARRADWVFILNNDTVVAPDTVSELVRAAQALGASIVAPLVYYLAEPEHIWDAGTIWPCWQPLPRRATVSSAPYRVDAVTGCGMMVAVSAIDPAELFDERYVMYYEDADLCLRLGQQGHVIAVAPRAKLWHAVGRSAGLASERTAEQRARYRLRFYRQHTPSMWRPLTLGLIIIQLGWRALRARLGGRHKVSLAIWRGIRAGCREHVERGS